MSGITTNLPASGIRREDQPANAWLPPWARTLALHWPHTEWMQTRGDFELAVRELNRAIDGNPPSDIELDEVARYMVGPESKQKYKPSVRDLMFAVFAHRKRNRQGAYGYAHGENPVADTQAAMLRARGWQERWNIMCDPVAAGVSARDLSVAETDEVNAWARRQWHEWDRETQAIRTRMAAEIGASIGKIANRCIDK